TTPGERFKIMIEVIVENTHYVATHTKPKVAAKIDHLACQLSAELKSSGLSPWFEASDIAALNNLAKQARHFERRGRKKLPAKAFEVFRKSFVSELLDAANKAGGRLGINRRTGRGSLVEAIDLLRPYLPAEFQRGLSARTLRRIRDTWSKNQKNN